MAAYKGQAPHIQDRAYLVPALAIHSVEARHAAWIRRLAGQAARRRPVRRAPLGRQPARHRRRTRASSSEERAAWVRRSPDERRRRARHRRRRLVERRLRRPGAPRGGRVAEGDLPAWSRGGRAARRSGPVHATLAAAARGRRATARRSRARRRRPAAHAVAARVPQTPEGGRPTLSLSSACPRADGGLWLRARLPRCRTRPGWVPRSALGGYADGSTRLVVDRGAFGRRCIGTAAPCCASRSASGAPAAPTPRGEFYIRNRLTRYRSPPTGPVAFGTSARSAAATDWPAGGYIGIHGTDRPDLDPRPRLTRLHPDAQRRPPPPGQAAPDGIPR